MHDEDLQLASEYGLMAVLQNLFSPPYSFLFAIHAYTYTHI